MLSPEITSEAHDSMVRVEGRLVILEHASSTGKEFCWVVRVKATQVD